MYQRNKLVLVGWVGVILLIATLVYSAMILLCVSVFRDMCVL